MADGQDGGLVTINAKERERLVTVRLVGEGKLWQAQAAERLVMSVRQVKRLVRAWRAQGAAGLVSKRRGRSSVQRVAQATREHFIGLVRQHCADYGPTLACKYLRRHHGLTNSRESLRGWMIEAGLGAGVRAGGRGQVFSLKPSLSLRNRQTHAGDRHTLGCRYRLYHGRRGHPIALFNPIVCVSLIRHVDAIVLGDLHISINSWWFR